MITGAAALEAETGARVQGETIVKPVVYGNTARAFHKERVEDGHTHQWTVYLKPYHNEDMSTYVKEVHFILHDSYPQPTRIITKPPYEITETGWSEFDIIIKIFFNDPKESTIVELHHVLRLFPLKSKTMVVQNTLVSEFYEEIVFQNPTALMQNLLTATRPLTEGPWKHYTDFEELKKKTLQSMQNKKEKIQREIHELKEMQNLAMEIIAKLQLE